MRKSFQEILKTVNINISDEYYRLSSLFYDRIIVYRIDTLRRGQSTLHDLINSNFTLISFRNNALTLDDFDRTYDFSFSDYHSEIDIDLFVTFCEYLANIITDIKSHLPVDCKNICDLIMEQIRSAIEKMSYTKLIQEKMISYVPLNTTAIIAAETIDNDVLAYNTIFYSHHSLKNDLNGKKEILLKFANFIESKKAEAKGSCEKLLDNINYAMNTFNIRHNNIDKTSKSYQEAFAKLSDKEQEELYDDTYQLCLEFLINIDNKQKIKKFEDMRRK